MRPDEVLLVDIRFDDYKVVLYRQDDGSWVAEIPAVGGCYALMDTREAALAELQHVFTLIEQQATPHLEFLVNDEEFRG
jgi:predicted RNase H-like HicB family nuclease